MPKPLKSAAALRLEEKQAKLRKIERSLRKQLAKQRQEDKNARQKAKRDLFTAEEKRKERAAFVELTKLENAPVDGQLLSMDRVAFNGTKTSELEKTIGARLNQKTTNGIPSVIKNVKPPNGSAKINCVFMNSFA